MLFIRFSAIPSPGGQATTIILYICILTHYLNDSRSIIFVNILRQLACMHYCSMAYIRGLHSLGKTGQPRILLNARC